MATVGASNNHRGNPRGLGDLDDILVGLGLDVATSRAGAKPVAPPKSATPLQPVTSAPTSQLNLQGALTAGEHQLMDNWLSIQGINLTRHARSLRAFAKDEFGSSPAAPSEAHIEAVNRFLDSLRVKLEEAARWVMAAAEAARREPTTVRLQTLLERKQTIGNRVLYVEGIWDFYYDLFVQRLSKFGERLRSVDRMAANCYEDLYIALGTAQPTPSLLPFSYAESGFSPATYRRGVPLARLRHNKNLFPIIMLPQHRLDNVWALSSVLHEVSHNLQADIGLWEIVPARLYQRLKGEGRIVDGVARIWARWHKEMMADMFALLLGGPAAVESLMDVVGRAPATTVKFSPNGVHPTPYLRVLINLVLLRRMGFEKMAADLKRVWQRLYPRLTASDIPPAFMQVFETASELAVDTMVFQPYQQLANKTLVQLLPFGAKEMGLVELAAKRLAEGQDPGSIPARFMIGAARFAIDHKLAKPQQITDNFYRTLGSR